MIIHYKITIGFLFLVDMEQASVFGLSLAYLQSQGSSPLKQALFLLALLALAYAVSHLVIERVSQRFGIVTGVEYILFGAILGGIGSLDTEMAYRFRPLIFLGIGTLGLLTGLRLNLRQFGRLDFEALRVAAVISFVTLLLVSALPAAVLFAAGKRELLVTILPALLCIGAVSMVATPKSIASLIEFMKAEGESALLVVSVAKFCASFAVIVFGLIFCFFNPRESPVTSSFGFWQWMGVHLLLGTVLGTIFAMFLRKGFSQEKTLTVVLGMVVFSSGLAYYLQLSPILVNAVLGLVLINTCSQGEEVEQMLSSIERPLCIVLFVFAGVSWNFVHRWWSFWLFAPYLLLRYIGRGLGGAVASFGSLLDKRLPGMGRALLAPGGLSVAMILNFDAVYGQTLYGPAVYTTLLLGVIISDVLSYSRTRSWLIDATGVRLEKNLEKPSEELV
ncbi:MAG: cation:proton antiporter [Acidobacteriota bacterium]|nr:cation:proton antiporter [Acidobacteriota bacterium]